MQAIYTLMRATTQFNDWLGRKIAYLVVPMFLLLLLEVFLRYVAGSPTVWTNELTQMLFGVYGVLAGGYIMAHGGHVNVDILHARLSRRGKALVDVLTSALFFIFVGALVYFGSAMAWDSLIRFEHSQSAWNPPIYPVKIAIPLGAVLLLIQGLVKLLSDIFVLAGLEEPQTVISDDHGKDQL